MPAQCSNVLAAFWEDKKKAALESAVGDAIAQIDSVLLDHEKMKSAYGERSDTFNSQLLGRKVVLRYFGIPIDSILSDQDVATLQQLYVEAGWSSVYLVSERRNLLDMAISSEERERIKTENIGNPDRYIHAFLYPDAR